MDNEKVHVVIVNWNGASDTEQCLGSLFTTETCSLRVTVIDNSSDHTPCEILRAKYTNVDFIFSDVNLGFSSACNLGWAKSVEMGARYTLFLNNDTIVLRSFLDELSEYLDINSDVAAVSPLINYYHAPSEPWFHSSCIDQVTMEIVHAPAENLMSPYRVPWLSGCAMFVRTELFSSSSGFDSKFFLYSEDVDLSLKLRCLGHNLAVVPTVAILHKVGAATNKVSRISTYYAVRNKLIVVRRYFQVDLLKYSFRLFRDSYGSVFRSSVTKRVKIMFFFVIFGAIVTGLMWRNQRFDLQNC